MVVNNPDACNTVEDGVAILSIIPTSCSVDEANAHRNNVTSSDEGQCPDTDFELVAPTEWMELDLDRRRFLTEYLSWESLSKWDFDVFELNDLLCQTNETSSYNIKTKRASTSEDIIPDDFRTKKYGLSRCSPLLILGWSIFAAPYSQLAMQQSLLINDTSSFNISISTDVDLQSDSLKKMGRYNFIDHLHLQPSKLINSLRCIESWYNDVPYHNNIHVLDVLHTLNVMLRRLPMQSEVAARSDLSQTIDGSNIQTAHDNTIHFSFLDNITSLDVYSILLSAIIHDISHEGLNNLYYQNNPLAFHELLSNVDVQSGVNLGEIMSKLTLEPFHDVFGRRLLQRHGAFEGLSDEEQKYSEEVISSAVIGTTMANHFDLFTLLQNEVQSAFSDEDGAATSEHGMDTRYNKTAFLSFLVHAADISSPTKPFPMFSQWIPRVFTEFFRQGDLEEKQGHPISPLCNRRELTEQTIAESQVMFINTFVKPMYELIGKICTWIEEDVVPLLDANLNAMTSWVDELKVKEKGEATK